MKITLCGSARFEPFFHLWNEVLTLSGHLVYGLAVYPSAKSGEKDWYTADEKATLDKMHLAKIEDSDAILVLNRYAYIGESTLREIEHAKLCGKKRFAKESWGKGFGIYGAHHERVREDAKRYGVLGKFSPIDTFWPEFHEPLDLLPEAGPYRTGLVQRLHSLDVPPESVSHLTNENSSGSSKGDK